MTWPANGATNWNTDMAAFVHTEHETDGTHGTKSGYQDRGDVNNADFTQATLTLDSGDGVFVDLDLSGISGLVGAKVVHLFVSMTDDSFGSRLRFRKKGHTNTANISSCVMQVANVSTNNDIIIGVDTSGVLQYDTNNTSWTGIGITVKGWWI